MGYEELRSEVVLAAVKDYKRMLRMCRKLNIEDPITYFRNYIYGTDDNDTYITRTFINGIDAEMFLNDKKRLRIFTDIDGKMILDHVRETA
mgnify:CR=1 FL=1